MKALTDCGYKIFPSEANYFLVEVGDAAAFRTSLLSNGILVRDCASFGLLDYIRIGVRTEDECRKLINIMQMEKNKI